MLWSSYLPASSSECWDYRCVAPYLALFYFVFVLFRAVLRVKPRRRQGHSPGVDLADRDVESGSNVLHSLVTLRDDTDTLGDGLGCDGVIAGDHDDL